LSNEKEKIIESLYIYIKKFTEELLEHILASIITKFSSSEPISSFVEELYLMHFPQNWRKFVHCFISTQMGGFIIEQKSRKCFESFSV
jgi:hypothetical protein